MGTLKTISFLSARLSAETLATGQWKRDRSTLERESTAVENIFPFLFPSFDFQKKNMYIIFVLLYSASICILYLWLSLKPKNSYMPRIDHFRYIKIRTWLRGLGE